MELPNHIHLLKQLKTLANFYLSFYSKHITGGKGWEKDLIKRNISLLKQIIHELHDMQHDKKIDAYLQAIRGLKEKSSSKDGIEYNSVEDILKFFDNLNGQSIPANLLRKIVRCSPFASYINDFTLFKYSSLDEKIQFGLGIVDETIFEKYFSYQLFAIEDELNTFFKKPFFSDDLVLIDSILILIKSENYVSTNILIMTLIEGLVRKFCKLVYTKQNPEKTIDEIEKFVYVRNPSFEQLIISKEWKRDIPIYILDLLRNYPYTEHEIIINAEDKIIKHEKARKRIFKNLSKIEETIYATLEDPNFHKTEDIILALHKQYLDIANDSKNEAKNLIKKDEKNIMIGIDVYLNFLLKNVKDDRNNIIHGKYSLYKEKWRTLLYINALDVLIEKIKWYEDNVMFI